MNIFVLDTEPRIAAHYHCDIHVRVMIKEAAQLMSTAHRILDDSKNPIYKLTHKHHPCTKWVMASISNYEWLYELFVCLHVEYQKRFNKDHKSFILNDQYLRYTPNNIPDIGITQFAQAMPAYFKQNDVVQAYRHYYCETKLRFANWSRPSMKPWWVHEYLLNNKHYVNYDPILSRENTLF